MKDFHKFQTRKQRKIHPLLVKSKNQIFLNSINRNILHKLFTRELLLDKEFSKIQLVTIESEQLQCLPIKKLLSNKESAVLITGNAKFNAE